MAIKVGGTSVINDSRQLQNIASIDSTTAAALLRGADEIGSYALALNADEHDFGDTLAGSSLRPANAGGRGKIPAEYLTGTWRCMGYNTGSAFTGSDTTLWLRIS
jgi:hypothetical protein